MSDEEVESNRHRARCSKFVRLGDRNAADGFDEEEVAPAAPKQQSKPAKTEPAKQEDKKPAAFDLNSLLG